MTNSALDLFEAPFWLALGTALLVLVPLKAPLVRRVTWALINLGFLGLILSWKQLVLVLGGVVGVYLLLKLIPLRRIGLLVLGFGAGALLAVFVLHKLPGLAAELRLGRLNPLLALIGFSYVALRMVDLSRAVFEHRHPPPDLASTVNYLLPFHMLAAGPIQAYDDFVSQPAIQPALTATQALAGVERISFGLFKKYVLALSIDKLFLTEFRAGGPYLLLEAQCFFLWVYLDFSAYSDISVGIGRLIGAATPENFNKPYLARNMIDYWNRWHISLSLFLRRHLFIPVQLVLLRRTEGKRPLLCASVAFLTAFLLCGLWHEISWRWLLWGALQALGLIITNLYQAALLRRLGRQGLKEYLANKWIRIFATFLTFEFVAFSLVVVRYPFREALG